MEVDLQRDHSAPLLIQLQRAGQITGVTMNVWGQSVSGASVGIACGDDTEGTYTVSDDEGFFSAQSLSRKPCVVLGSFMGRAVGLVESVMPQEDGDSLVEVVLRSPGRLRVTRQDAAGPAPVLTTAMGFSIEKLLRSGALSLSSPLSTGEHEGTVLWPVVPAGDYFLIDPAAGRRFAVHVAEGEERSVDFHGN